MTDAAARKAELAAERKLRWIVRLGTLLIRVLALTWRVRTINAGEQRERRKNGPVVFVLWHGEMLPLLWQHRQQGVAILISEHRDGEIIARIAERLGYTTVRGSTSRGAGRALIEMSRVLASGTDVAITPDGPRGPAHVMAPGAPIVAARSSVPMLMLTARASRAWRLKSWDRFMIPKPFARVVVAYAPLVWTTDDARAAAAETPRLERTMQEIGAQAEAALV